LNFFFNYKTPYYRYVPGQAQHIFLPLFPILGAGLAASVGAGVVVVVLTIVYKKSIIIKNHVQRKKSVYVFYDEFKNNIKKNNLYMYM